MVARNRISYRAWKHIHRDDRSKLRIFYVKEMIVLIDFESTNIYGSGDIQATTCELIPNYIHYF